MLRTLVTFFRKRYNLPESMEHELKTSLDDFTVIKSISRGAFGRVYLASHNENGKIFALKVILNYLQTVLTIFAMKVLRKEHLISQNMVRHVTRERNILASADSPFVVKCHYAFTTARNIHLVMEYVPGNSQTQRLLVTDQTKQEEIATVYYRMWEL